MSDYLSRFGIPGLTDDERDRLHAALEEDRVVTAPSGGAAHGTDVPGEWVEAAEMAIMYAVRPDGVHPDDWPTCWDTAEIAVAAVMPLVTAENAALRAELATLHASDDYQRWARAVTERDAARAEVVALRERADSEAVRGNEAEVTVARVEAVVDEVCCNDCHADLRAALAGPKETT